MTRTTLNMAALAGVPLIAAVLWVWGQPWICTCGTIRLWVGSIWDSGNSQHIADWYTLSHILHGVLIALIGRVALPKLDFKWLFAIAIITGIGWEVIEHTDWVLGKFRATTVNQGYTGDSILNAVADYIWMMGGFFAAWHLRVPVTLGLVAALELTAALIGRDSLALTTLMLIYPVDAIAEWQQELNPNGP
ncbi:DUF2585 family protein [Gymnodinialimonas sp. 2305UL16-5]|uniref:DUF2585 family protein n=1 Tax=Gymnodinialimonas mytili TaxID=3126503 RepID=UPI00309B1A03